MADSINSCSGDVLFANSLPLLFLDSILFFEPVSFRHRRSIYISQHCRNHYLSDLRPPAQEDTLEKDFAARRRISVVGVCMVLSCLGIELFSKELLPTDRNSVYRLHTREFSEVHERIYYPTEPFVHSHKQY